MSLSVQPIIAASCMACTVPFNNSTSYEKIEPYQNNTINYKKEKKIYIVHATQAKSVATKRVFNVDNNYYMSKAVSKYRPMKISRKNRKIHNIHQPGRTNCSQRYQRYHTLSWVVTITYQVLIVLVWQNQSYCRKIHMFILWYV